jgi:hypothetical protein
MNKKIGLSEMITVLRQELEEAQEKSAEERLRFTLEDIELELQIIAEESNKYAAGFQFWVFNPSVEDSDKDVRAQTLRLRLKVSDNGGDPDSPKRPVTIHGEVSD